jgi:hypothetical protein
MNWLCHETPWSPDPFTDITSQTGLAAHQAGLQVPAGHAGGHWHVSSILGGTAIYVALASTLFAR